MHETHLLLCAGLIFHMAANIVLWFIAAKRYGQGVDTLSERFKDHNGL